VIQRRVSITYAAVAFFLCSTVLPRCAYPQARQIPPAEKASGNHEKYVPGHVIVRYKDGMRARAKITANAVLGAKTLRSYKFLPNMEVVKLPSYVAVEQALRTYMQNPSVEYAEPDYRVYPTTSPNDPLQFLLWGMNNTGQDGGTPGADISVLQAWAFTTGSKDIVIGSLDTGVDYTHPDILPNLYHNPNDCTFNYVDDDNNGYVDDCWGLNVVTDDPYDYIGHGTHVLGTIGAAGNNGIGVAGVNWNITLLPCKFIAGDGGSASGAIACLDYMATMKDRGYNIVATNNSWGGGYPSRALRDAIRAQADKGILFIAAAGNNGLDADLIGQYPASYDVPNIIAVAASDRTDQMATFSNFGKRSVDISAPGVGVVSTMAGQTYQALSGTSMATPHVSGVAALLKSNDPTLDWKAIRGRILAGGVDAGMLSNTLTGKRLNAYGALTCADSEVIGRRMPRNEGTSSSIGGKVKISVLHINCGDPAGEVQAQIEPGNLSLTLQDDGSDPDEIAGDGIYSAYFQPQSGGVYTATLPNGDSFQILALKSYKFGSTPYSYRTITGTNLNLEDETVATIQVPFPIHFGGQTFQKLYVGDNGLISFDHPFNVAPGLQLPYFEGGAFLAPFWDDLQPLYPGDRNVFWEVVGTAPNRELVIEWRNVVHYWYYDDGSITFQVVLSESKDDVIFNYSDTAFGGMWYQWDNGAMATVGIQVSPTEATTFSSYTASLSNGMSLLWQTVDPDFTIGLDTSNLSAYPGEPAVATGTVTSIYGLNDNIQIQCGVGGPANCSPVTVQPNDYGQAFSISFSDSSTGQLNFSLIAQDAARNLSHSAPVTLNLIDIALADPSPKSISIPNGGSATVTVQVSAVGSFDRDVQMGCTSSIGATCTFSPSIIQPRPGAPVTVTVNITLPQNTTQNSFDLSIWAKGVGQLATKATTVSASVTRNPDFIITSNVNSVGLIPTDSTTFSVQLEPQDGYSKPVTLSCSTSAAPLTCSVTPSSATPPSVANVTVTGNGAPIQNAYSVIVKGDDGTNAHTISVPVVFPDFVVDGPGAADLYGDSTTLNFTVVPRSGLNGTFAISCDVSALPANSTCMPSFSAITASSPFAVQVTVRFGAIVPGTFPVKLSASLSSSGFTTETIANVTVRGFSLAIQGEQNPVVPVGGNVDMDLLITPMSSTPMTVNLQAWGGYAGLNLSVTPGQVTLGTDPVHVTVSVQNPQVDYTPYITDQATVELLAQVQAPVVFNYAFDFKVRLQDFTLISPLSDYYDAMGVAIGHDASLTFKMKQTGGLNVPVTVACSQDLPSGASCRFDKQTVGPNEDVTLTVSAAADFQPGIRYIDLVATGTVNGQSIRHVLTQTVIFTSFSVSLTPDSLSQPVGAEGVYFLSSTGPQLEEMSLDCQASGPGVTCESPLSAPIGSQVVITARSTPGLTPAGKYTFDITATALSETHTVTGTLFVQGQDAILVTSPNGQELWTSGTKDITWKYSGDSGPTVKIELLKKGAVVMQIADQVPIGAGGKGYYSWAIPDSLPFSQYYKVRVSSDSRPSLTDDSDDRVWIGRGVDFAGSMAGYVLYPPNYLFVNYTWSGYSIVSLDLYKGGQFVQNLAPPQSGGYFAGPGWQWSIGTTSYYDLQPGTDYTLKLIPQDDPSRAVMSDAFTISHTGITITSPGKEDVYKPGDTIHLTWTWYGDPVKPGPDLTVNLAKTGYQVSTIARSAPLGANGSGALTWTVPTNLPWGQNYYFNVQANTGHGGAQSDFFWIGEAGTVNVTSSEDGQIQSDDYNLTCGMGATQCSAKYMKNTTVTLKAFPKSLYTFTGWTGACSGTSNCLIDVQGDVSVGAEFEAIQQDFSFAGSGPLQQTVKAGNSASYTFTVNRNTELANDIAFSCTGLPAASSCSFSPAVVSRLTNSEAVTLKLSTTARSMALRMFPDSNPWNSLGVIASVAAVPWFLRRRNRRTKATRSWLPLMLLWLSLGIACGGGGGESTVQPPPPYTAPGTYNITVNATSGEIVRSVQVQLVVQ
jgi:hypothetical protein